MSPQEIRDFSGAIQSHDRALVDAARWMGPMIFRYLHELDSRDLVKIKSELTRFDSHKEVWRVK